MSAGYSFSWGPTHYDQWKDGRPITLGDALEACHGVCSARIYRPDGSLMLVDAGSRVALRYEVGRRRRALIERRWAARRVAS